MDSTKYQIFISSTYKDFEKEREGAIKAILEMYHIPIGMEMFSAEDEEQWEIIRRTIEVSDYYILILGLRYGSKTTEGISYTQKEYEYALEKQIPILAFIMDDNVAISKSNRDDDLSEINNFRKLVLKNSKMAQFWKTKDELIKSISISLMKQMRQKPRIGWVRADRLGNEKALANELTTLSKENRELREKIIELESKISYRAPKIELNINEPKIDDNYDVFDKVTIPTKLCTNDIEEHLEKYVTEEDIEAYNNKIPTQTEIDKFNSELEQYSKIENYSTPLVIEVNNNGSIKANNLYIDIYIPKEFLIYNKNKIFSKPKSPIPTNPIIAAIEEHQRERLYIGGIFSVLKELNSLNSTLDSIGKISHISNRIPMIPIANSQYQISLNDNKLSIHIKNLVHTRQIVIDDKYMITPLQKGTYQIETHIIYEELEKAEIKTIEWNIK